MAPPGHYPFRPANTYVYGVFTVPVAREAYNLCNVNTRYASFWVGIDGFNSPDVLQAGIEADASCSSQITSAYYSAWYEWYPDYEIRVSSPAVGPGDEIYVYVWNTSRTVGNYYMVNYTQNEVSSLSFDAPSGTQLVGDLVEWIAERPSIGGTLAMLTNYVAEPVVLRVRAHGFGSLLFGVAADGHDGLQHHHAGQRPQPHQLLRRHAGRQDELRRRIGRELYLARQRPMVLRRRIGATEQLNSALKRGGNSRAFY